MDKKCKNNENEWCKLKQKFCVGFRADCKDKLVEIEEKC